MTFQQIQKYERGTNRVSASRLVILGQALGVTPAYFFTGLPTGGEGESAAMITVEDARDHLLAQSHEMARLIKSLVELPVGARKDAMKGCLGLVRAIGERGIRCPEDVSVVGFDDFTWTENFHPRLTTVAQPARELGRRAMQLLLERVENTAEEFPARQVVLKQELRVRESTAPLVASPR